MEDRFGHHISYLRVSITDRCNERCQYCMPHEEQDWLPRSEVLSYEEILRVIRVGAGLGISKVRVTGGEPLTRRDVVWFLEELARIDGIRDLVLLKLEAVGLRGAAQLMPADLSGGMARRVALARSVALDPELILFDEPFTGLDPISLSIIATLIRRLTDALGATSVMVTHDVHESLAVVDYVYFMSSGRVVGSGTPEEIRVSSDPYVYQFVHAQPDGPVHFHYPAPELDAELLEGV